MKIIAHRANLTGPAEGSENEPSMIDKCIQMGFDVEVDIRFHQDEQEFLLGHDQGEYVVSLDWLLDRKSSLWIHCKDSGSILQLSEKAQDLNFFWHNDDKYTMTNKGFIWSYPGNPVNGIGVIVMPEWTWDNLEKQQIPACYGICTDYPIKIRGLSGL